MAEDKKTGEPADKGSVVSEEVAPSSSCHGTESTSDEGQSSRRPYWNKWKCCQSYEVDLAEAVALSCNFDPSVFDDEDTPDLLDRDFDRYSSRLYVAERAVGNDLNARRIPERNGVDSFRVRLGVFASWAIKMQTNWPELWQELPDELVTLALNGPAPRWPWGDRATELLDHMAVAADLWREYTPETPAIAPTNDDVVEFLTKRKWGKKPFPKRVAQVMAQILRDDQLKSGPRNNS